MNGRLEGFGLRTGMTSSGGIPDCVDGGLDRCGGVFEFAPAGTETVLYSFDENDGEYDPGQGSLTMDKRGNSKALHGKAELGANRSGTIFRIRN
ncbi:MAG TPA: hypothetical protein VGL35_14630 [Rhizomicrobium sp.]|jgi:hypothetical protein